MSQPEGSPAVERFLNPGQTIGDRYGELEEITHPAAVKAMFELLVRTRMALEQCDRAAALAIERSNVGYWTGYMSREAGRRWEAATGCIHPILGTMAERESLTPQELFERGQRLGTLLQEGVSMDEAIRAVRSDGRLPDEPAPEAADPRVTRHLDPDTWQ